MRLSLFFLILFVCAGLLKTSAQDFQELDAIVPVTQESRIDSLISMHRKAMEMNLAHEEHDGLLGHRIQIYFESGNNSKNSAIREKDRFDRRYPQVPSYIIFGEPYYRVRVGDFRTKMEAEAFLKMIVGRYPNAFITKEKIKFPKLLDN